MKKAWMLAVCFVAVPLFAGVRADLRNGGTFYHHQQYGQALDAYRQALQKDPQDARASFGAGASAYYLKDYATAEKAFEQVLHTDKKMSQDALFNLGNTYYRANDKEKAIASYKQAILQNPDDKEAIHNLQLIIDQQNQNNQNQKNDQNQDKDSNNQDNKDSSKQDGQSPQEKQEKQAQQQPNQMQQDDAQRILQMARDNEQKAPSRPNQSGAGQNSSNVEKDW